MKCCTELRVALAVGRRCPPKLSSEQRRDVVRMHGDGTPTKAIARHFGISAPSVKYLVRSRRYGVNARVAGMNGVAGMPSLVQTMTTGVRRPGARTGVA